MEGVFMVLFYSPFLISLSVSCQIHCLGASDPAAIKVYGKITAYVKHNFDQS